MGQHIANRHIGVRVRVTKIINSLVELIAESVEMFVWVCQHIFQPLISWNTSMPDLKVYLHIYTQTTDII